LEFEEKNPDCNQTTLEHVGLNLPDCVPMNRDAESPVLVKSHLQVDMAPS
jgi:hypothetical protein